ncbi:MAG TPA: ATP-binding protein [Acidimicrobiales bacterium]|nr:ATP-binding protein [Acidimicrobiales bacterium]
MSAFAAQYQFASAFTVFLVALAGLALVALRGAPLTEDRGAQLALALGFAGVGSAAFLQGSLLFEDRAAPVLLALRLAGLAGVVLGSLAWRGSALSRSLLWAGCTALLGAFALEVADVSTAAAAVSALGALLVGAALLGASRRAITARVAASAAGTLLLLVLVLSVALSTILADTAQDQALGDLDSRAVTEAGAVETQAVVAGRDAGTIAQLLSNFRSTDDPTTTFLSQVDAGGSVNEVQRNALVTELARLRAGGYPDTGFLYVSERREPVAGDGLPAEAAAELSAGKLVGDTLADRKSRRATLVAGGRAFAVGVVAVQRQDQKPLGVILSAFALDDRYLDLRTGNVSNDAVALLGPDGAVVAKAGALPSAAARRTLVDRVLVQRRERATIVTETRFVAAEPARDGGAPVLAVLASRSTSAVEAGRKRLFQTFFVIAFGGTVLALLLAALVGNRIGSGIRRLTTSVEAIQRGELGVRSGVRTEDEVGVLGQTFDSMAASIEEQTDALQEAAARVEAIVAGMGEALVAVDAGGNITDFNAAAEELLDLAASDARTLPLDQVLAIRREDGSDLAPRLRRLEPARWSELGDLVLRDGRSIPVALTAGALRGPDGEVTGGVIVVRDLRGEREVERMKRHFLSRVGHELRTPLTPLIGYSQMLAGRDIPPERAKQVYNSILSSAKRLERIVEMLEFFASLDAGRLVLHAEPVDVRVVLGDVVARRGAALAGTPHTIVKRVAKDTPVVSVDEKWLGRSVDELVDNAVKFSPDGGRVTVSAGPLEGDPSMVEIAVVDRGVGMSPDEVDSAFTEWAQGDESDTRSFGGLGLGLALVQRVAEHHGGRVQCVTAPGKGSRFSIVLPALFPERRRRPRTKRSPAARVAES